MIIELWQMVMAHSSLVITVYNATILIVLTRLRTNLIKNIQRTNTLY